MSLQTILKKIFSVSGYINRSFNSSEYLASLSDNDETNLTLFARFVSTNSITLLCVLDSFGYFAENRMLSDLVREDVYCRDSFSRLPEFDGEREEDVGGHIEAFMRRHNVTSGGN